MVISVFNKIGLFMLFRVRIQWELFFLVSEKLHSVFKQLIRFPLAMNILTARRLK